MKKKERRPKEMGSQWLNAMCEVLKGGVLAGVVTILVLLICAVLVSVGLVPVEAMYGTAGKKAQEKTQKMIEISRALCYNTSTMAENAVSKPNRRRN